MISLTFILGQIEPPSDDTPSRSWRTAKAIEPSCLLDSIVRLTTSVAGIDLFNIITSNIQLAEAPGNVLLPRSASGLSRDCVVNVSQIFTIDKTFLAERIGSLPDYLQEEIDEGLRTGLYL
jgi:mRNA-degrading endonuclease toxin of MazEF toxin-antitoxin module